MSSFYIPTVPSNLLNGLSTVSIGEERWGLNIASLLLQEGHKVFFPPATAWRTDQPVPGNLILQTVPDHEYTYIGYFTHTPMSDLATKRILCCFDSPKVLEIPDKTIIVHPYPAGNRFTDLKKKGGDRVKFLPHVIDIEHDHRNMFENKDLFWTAKGGFNPYSQSATLTEQCVKWIAHELKRNPSSMFYMVSAAHGVEQNECIEKIKHHNLYQKYLKELHSQVIILDPLTPYSRILELLKNTKIVINPGSFEHTYGGSPIEAAMLGIPTVNYSNQSPFVQLDGCMTISNSKQDEKYIEFLHKLMYNPNFYEEKAKLYKEYVVSTYGKERFLLELTTILG
jgi:hypothetical protein